VARLVEISERSISVLFREQGRYVWRLLRYFGVPDPELEDAVQDVFVVVHRKREQWRDDVPARAWLGGIARRVALDRRRKLARRREVVAADPAQELASAADAHDRVEEAEARQCLLNALDLLDEGQRAVFVLHVIEGVPLKDVARSMGCALPTAYYRLDRARAALRRAALASPEAP